MEQEEIIEGNRLIADFMGQPLTSQEVTYGRLIKTITKFRVFRYHTSWDWLMPVIEKIEDIKGCKVFLNQVGCVVMSYGKCISRHCASTKIKAVWLAIVEFIKWYNLNKTPLP